MKILAGIIMAITMAFIGCSDDDIYNVYPTYPDSTAVCPTDSTDTPIPPFNICEIHILNPNGKIIHTYLISEILEYRSDCILFRTYSGKLKKVKNKKFILVACE